MEKGHKYSEVLNGFCRACLRNDRPLRSVSDDITSAYRIFVSQIDSGNSPNFCSYCELQMVKTVRFLKQCCEANEVLKSFHWFIRKGQLQVHSNLEVKHLEPTNIYPDVGYHVQKEESDSENDSRSETSHTLSDLDENLIFTEANETDNVSDKKELERTENSDAKGDLDTKDKDSDEESLCSSNNTETDSRKTFGDGSKKHFQDLEPVKADPLRTPVDHFSKSVIFSQEIANSNRNDTAPCRFIDSPMTQLFANETPTEINNAFFILSPESTAFEMNKIKRTYVPDTSQESGNEDSKSMDPDVSSQPQGSTRSLKRKRIWNRRNFCLFCKKLVTNFSRHLIRHHNDKTEVKEFLSIQDKDKKIRKKKRQAITESLRNRGNYLYNCNVRNVSQNEGLLLKRRTNVEAIDADASQFVICKNCLGTFRRKSFYRHKKKCGECSQSKRTLKSESFPICRCSQNVSPEIDTTISPHLKNDLMIKQDTSILPFGPRSFKKKKEQGSRKNICSESESTEQPKDTQIDNIMIEELITNQPMNEFRKRKVTMHRKWTDKQIHVVKKHFEQEILQKKNPGKAKCIDVLKREPILQNRTWMQLNTFVNNMYTKGINI